MDAQHHLALCATNARGTVFTDSLFSSNLGNLDPLLHCMLQISTKLAVLHIGILLGRHFTTFSLQGFWTRPVYPSSHPLRLLASIHVSHTFSNFSFGQEDIYISGYHSIYLHPFGFEEGILVWVKRKRRNVEQKAAAGLWQMEWAFLLFVSPLTPLGDNSKYSDCLNTWVSSLQCPSSLSLNQFPDCVLQ